MRRSATASGVPPLRHFPPPAYFGSSCPGCVLRLRNPCSPQIAPRWSLGIGLLRLSSGISVCGGDYSAVQRVLPGMHSRVGSGACNHFLSEAGSGRLVFGGSIQSCAYAERSGNGLKWILLSVDSAKAEPGHYKGRCLSPLIPSQTQIPIDVN